MLLTRRQDDDIETAMLDVRGLQGPWPLHWTRHRMGTLLPGRPLKVVSTEPHLALEIQEMTGPAEELELVRQEEGCDDRGRRTYTLVLRRKS